MPHELKKAIESLLEADACCFERSPDPRVNIAIDHLRQVYEPVKDKL